jgi:DNA-directed RNA polymerase subunit RPC12/RpoP
MHTLHPGEWYLRYTCIKCGSKQVLFPDLSQGKAEIKGIYVVTCTKCRHKDSYDIETIERYHHPADAQPVLSDGL